MGIPIHFGSFYRYLDYSLTLILTQRPEVPEGKPTWKWGMPTRLLDPPAHALNPVMTLNTGSSCLTAAAGTGLAGTKDLEMSGI